MPWSQKKNEEEVVAQRGPLRGSAALTWRSCSSFVHSFIHSFIHSFVYSFIHSLSFIYSTQAHIGSLAASPHRVTCSVRSMLSALDCKPTSGHLHLLCPVRSMLSALDCKPTSGHLLCSVYAFGTRLQAQTTREVPGGVLSRCGDRQRASARASAGARLLFLGLAS
jgi:hypothetical protein